MNAVKKSHPYSFNPNVSKVPNKGTIILSLYFNAWQPITVLI